MRSTFSVEKRKQRDVALCSISLLCIFSNTSFGDLIKGKYPIMSFSDCVENAPTLVGGGSDYRGAYKSQ